MDGSSGYISEVVWFLPPASSGSSLSRRHGGVVGWDAERYRADGVRVGPYGYTTISSSPVSNSSFSFNSMQNSVVQNLDDWIRPSLPALRFAPGDLLPNDMLNLSRQYVPISIYRHMRLLRALGETPRNLSLPPAAALGSVSREGASSSRNVSSCGPYRGDDAAIHWNAQAFVCSDPGKFAAKTFILQVFWIELT